VDRQREDHSIDDEIAELLHPEDVALVTSWAQQCRVDLFYATWQDRGYTGAVLFAAYVHATNFENENEYTTKQILKYIPSSGGRETTEPNRQIVAWKDAPKKFRRSHLVRQCREPVQLSNGAWLMFQDVAGGGSLQALRTLATMVRDRKLWADAARVVTHVTAAVLGEWNPKSGVPRPRHITAGEYISELLGDRLTPNGTVSSWAVTHGLLSGSPLVPTETKVGNWPNPFLLISSGNASAHVKVLVRSGNCHGDLHPGNILVGSTPEDFWLIDLARHDPKRSLAFDPMYLLVTMVAQLLSTVIDESDREAVAELLIAQPKSSSSAPEPFPALVDALVKTGIKLCGTDGLADEWRAETLLTLVACALIMTGRNLISDSDRKWFLSLAARAADTYTTEFSGGARSSPIHHDAPRPVGPSIGEQHETPTLTAQPNGSHLHVWIKYPIVRIFVSLLVAVVLFITWLLYSSGPTVNHKTLTMPTGYDLDLKRGLVGHSAPMDVTLYDRKTTAEPFTLSAVGDTKLAETDTADSLSACQTALASEQAGQQFSFSPDPEKGRLPAALCGETADGTIASMRIGFKQLSLPGELTVTMDIWPGGR